MFQTLSWSPEDGQRLAFTRLDSDFGPTDLLVVDADGRNLRRIATCGSTDCLWGPVFSPDGTQIVFQRGLNLFVCARTELGTSGDPL